MLRTFPWRSARFFATGLASYQTISAAELLASASGPALCIFFSLVGLNCGARWGFGGVECSFCSPPTSFCPRESTRSIRNRSSSCSLHLFRRRAPSDLRVCDFSFALSFVRFHPTGARVSLRVTAGCTPGPSPSTPSEHMPRRWFALKPRKTSSSRTYEAPWHRDSRSRHHGRYSGSAFARTFHRVL